jgi:hypothetical protein
MAIQGTTTVISPIGPTKETDDYPVTLPKYGKGGLRSVLTLTERNLITEKRREKGRLVYVEEEAKYYTLTNGITDNDWQQVTLVNTDAEGNIYISGNLIVSGYIQTDTGIQGDTDNPEEYLGNGMVMDCGQY